MTDITATITRLRELIEEAGGPRRWRYLNMGHHIDIDWCGYEDDDSANLYVNVGHILIDGEPTEATKDHARSRLIVGALNALPALLDALEGKTAALRNILHARPGGPCPNKLVEKIENIARDALDKFK